MHQAPPCDPDALRGMELFVGLTDAALVETLANARVREVAKDTVIFRQDDAAAYCYAVLRGRVRISQSDEDGAQLLVRFIGPGEMFGTVALFTGGTYPAEAVTTLDSVVASWREESLLQLIDSHPGIALNIVKIIGARLRELQERLREVATQRAHRRIARMLLRLHGQTQAAAGGDAAFPLSRQDIAEMCGTTLHTASRVLTEWEKKGLLSTNRRQVTLRRVEDIRRIADDAEDQ
jgi:CRP-like cAMP-binding protein